MRVVDDGERFSLRVFGPRRTRTEGTSSFDVVVARGLERTRAGAPAGDSGSFCLSCVIAEADDEVELLASAVASGRVATRRRDEAEIDVGTLVAVFDR